MLMKMHYIICLSICLLFVCQCVYMNYHGCKHLQKEGEFTKDSEFNLYKIMFKSSWFWCLVMVIITFTLSGRAIILGGLPYWMIVFLVFSYVYSIGHMLFQYISLNNAIKLLKSGDF